jgi:N6-L-threonylcarbamoyladenine synthase
MQYSTILGIESSCDDTAVAVWKNGKILANVVAGQAIHEQYGGVVPELASRAHQSNIVPVAEAACKKAGIVISDLNAIAYTRGPGLMGSLHVGGNFAKGLSLGLNIPLIGVNHLQAHIAALYIDNPEPKFPILCLLVSGGHTQLLIVSSFMQMEIVGTTLDDAAGEAFDKAAKLLGLPYPGGPLIDKYAVLGDRNRFPFPQSNVPNLDFSFSGIKTNLLYFLRDQMALDPLFIENNLNDICASFQSTIIKALLKKTEIAIQQLNPASLGLAGGVSANNDLRIQINELAHRYKITPLIPAFEYCTDNAAMIAIGGHYLLEKGEQTSITALPYTRL